MDIYISIKKIIDKLKKPTNIVWLASLIVAVLFSVNSAKGIYSNETILSLLVFIAFTLILERLEFFEHISQELNKFGLPKNRFIPITFRKEREEKQLEVKQLLLSANKEICISASFLKKTFENEIRNLIKNKLDENKDLKIKLIMHNPNCAASNLAGHHIWYQNPDHFHEEMLATLKNPQVRNLLTTYQSQIELRLWDGSLDYGLLFIDPNEWYSGKCRIAIQPYKCPIDDNLDLFISYKDNTDAFKIFWNEFNAIWEDKNCLAYINWLDEIKKIESPTNITS